jgi:hypothetical protein
MSQTIKSATYQTGKWRQKETKTKNMEKNEPENFYSTS